MLYIIYAIFTLLETRNSHSCLSGIPREHSFLSWEAREWDAGDPTELPWQAVFLEVIRRRFEPSWVNTNEI